MQGICGGTIRGWRKTEALGGRGMEGISPGQGMWKDLERALCTSTSRFEASLICEYCPSFFLHMPYTVDLILFPYISAATLLTDEFSGSTVFERQPAVTSKRPTLVPNVCRPGMINTTWCSMRGTIEAQMVLRRLGKVCLLGPNVFIISTPASPVQRAVRPCFSNIDRGASGSGGGGGVNGGSGGLGEGPRVKMCVKCLFLAVKSVLTTSSVAERTYTNITKNYSAAPTPTSNFRTISLGDIDLQREIQLDSDSGIINLRRLHAAKIEGSDVTCTVAMYQGVGAEDEWRSDMMKYMAVRHPNIVQLYGVVSCGNIHAAVFHDNLIPFQQFLDLYRHSHFS
ncbi:hypothetical protein C8R45DRAFT_1080534, partial [Mycena sanguinolenta]